MRDEEELERIIREKDFAALTETEKDFVLQMIASEEEYEGLRKIELTIAQHDFKSHVEPRKPILATLKAAMNAEHVAKWHWRRVLQFRIPAYAAALIVIACCSLVLWLKARPPVQASFSQITPAKARIDTVFVTRIDTVTRQRIIYKQVNLTPSSREESAADFVPTKYSVSGVSMKEKEELNKLLVSGSD
jgi:hypothetical protein